MLQLGGRRTQVCTACGTTGMQCAWQCITDDSTQRVKCMFILCNTYCLASCLDIGQLCAWLTLVILTKALIVSLLLLIGLPTITYWTTYYHLLDYNNWFKEDTQRLLFVTSLPLLTINATGCQPLHHQSINSSAHWSSMASSFVETFSYFWK